MQWIYVMWHNGMFQNGDDEEKASICISLHLNDDHHIIITNVSSHFRDDEWTNGNMSYTNYGYYCKISQFCPS